MSPKTASKILVVLVVVAAVLALYFTFGVSGSTGTLKMQITDAPSALNIQSAVVTLSSIEVHTADTNNSNEINATNFTAGWITIVQGPVSYDLVSLRNVTQLLGSQQLGVGKYTQIRLLVTEANVTIDNKSYSLKVPSDKIKLIHEFTIEAGKTTTLTLDFNAQDSIKQTGVNNYSLQPTIEVIQE